MCSKHFIDDSPTEMNPYPTENLGYDSKRKVEIVTNCSSGNRGIRKRVKLSQPNPPTVDSTFIEHDHSYFSYSAPSSSSSEYVEGDTSFEYQEVNNANDGGIFVKLLQVLMFLHGFMISSRVLNFIYVLIMNCRRRLDVIQILRTQVLSLREENEQLRRYVDHLERKEKSCKCKLSLFEQLIKNDDDVLFYTGIPNVSTFQALHKFIAPYVRHLWRGAKVTSTKIKRKFKSVPDRFGPARKMCGLDQFLLMWMKLRLNAPMRDLANRFNVSNTTCSRIFSSWTKASAAILKSFIFVPDQGVINATKPPRFSSVINLNMIIDCTELFIQTPKNHLLQRLTWSSYKHHNTLKILIGVSPNSMITFISQAYCGAISDKEICKQSRLYDSLEPYCKIMADKGFLISQECAAHCIHLIVPPGRRGHAQMPSGNVLKTKEIAQLRILVEQVIRRLKTFRILTQEIPLNMISHVDDIMVLCSAVSNMKEPIMK